MVTKGLPRYSGVHHGAHDKAGHFGRVRAYIDRVNPEGSNGDLE